MIPAKMMFFVIALSFFGVTSALDSNTIDVKTAYNEYCEICEDHTLCKFEGLGEACEGSTDGGVTIEERNYILDTHNRYRRHVAKGLETRGANGSQFEAANMEKMVWDEELAKIAQHWADQCSFQHDTCRHDRRFRVGQNIYWNWRFPISKEVNWTAAIASWYDEVDKYDPSLTYAYEFDPETGHYTQLMWHDSALVGCGRRTYGPNKIYVCNYGPTGNWLNESMYEVGSPCSQCPDGMTCDDGLCAKGSDDAEESVQPLSAPVNILTAETATDLPIHLNIIDDLSIPDDEEIKKEIEDLKKRIHDLVLKIARKNSQKVE